MTSTHIDEKALKPCPFCGDLARLRIPGNVFDGDPGYLIECAGQCRGMTTHWHTEEQAREAWNRRNLPEAGEPVVEQIAAALWFDYVDQQGYPNGLPTWGELVAQGHQGQKRVEEFRSLAQAALRAHPRQESRTFEDVERLAQEHVARVTGQDIDWNDPKSALPGFVHAADILTAYWRAHPDKMADVRALSTKPQEAGAPSGLPFGIIDPEYARAFTLIRKLAWEHGYAIGLHGSFTRDLDLIAVPWTDRAHDFDHLLDRILAATDTQLAGAEPGKKPHGRLAHTLVFKKFGDPRFIDLSVLPTPPQASAEQEAVDAARWRALMSSQRMHFMGSAGFKFIGNEESRKIADITAIEVNPEGHGLHFGMEFWDKHTAHGDPRYPDDFERRLLTFYADELRKRPVTTQTGEG